MACCVVKEWSNTDLAKWMQRQGHSEKAIQTVQTNPELDGTFLVADPETFLSYLPKISSDKMKVALINYQGWVRAQVA